MLSSYVKSPENQPVRLVEVDTRGRISLRKFTEEKYFTLTVDGEGVITLTPALVMPVNDTTRKIEEFIQDPTAGVSVQRPTSRPSLSPFKPVSEAPVAP